jgi:hypothetical protein
MLDIYNLHDKARQLAQFWELVRQHRTSADRMRGDILRSPEYKALDQLQTETEALLSEVKYLVTNAPLQLHQHLGDQVFEDMHHDVESAVALSSHASLETTCTALGWERLSISIALALYVLDLLGESVKLTVAASMSDHLQTSMVLVSRPGTVMGHSTEGAHR